MTEEEVEWTLEDAKSMIREFVEQEISKYVKVLGRDHLYEPCDCFISDLEKCFSLLEENNIF